MGPQLEAHYRFHDVGLTLSADQPWLLTAAESVLSPMARTTGPEGERRAKVTVSARSIEPYIPEDLHDRIEIRFRHFSTTCYTADGDLWLMDDGVVIRMPRDSGECMAWVREAAHTNPSGYVGALIVTVIELFRHLGLYQLHAGCVSKDDRCVLFCGGQQHGKSTATIAMARSGWHCVTDDLLYLRDQMDGTVGGQGWREDFNVGQATQAAFELSQHVGSLRHDGRHTMDPSIFSFADDSVPVRPTHLVFTRIAHTDRSVLEPVARADALSRMIQYSPMVLVAGRRAGEHLDLLRRVVLQCQCFDLHAGRDVLEGHLPSILQPIFREP